MCSGIASLRMTFVIASVAATPGLETTIVYRSVSPASTGVATDRSATVLETVRFPGNSSVSVSVAVLLDGLGSFERSLVETLTVLTSEPVALSQRLGNDGVDRRAASG